MSKQNKQQQELDDIAIDGEAMKQLEHDVFKVLDNMEQDPSLERFRQEYEKLYRALKTSHTNEKQLLKQCKELSNDIIEHAIKVESALKLSDQDSQTIEKLKQEVDKTFLILEQTKDRDERNKAKMENLQAEIQELNSFIEKGQNLASGQTKTVQKLTEEQQKLSGDRDTLNDQISKIEEQRVDLFNVIKVSEQEKANIENDLKSLQKQHVETEERVNKEEDRNNKIQEELDWRIKNFEEVLEESKNYDIKLKGNDTEVADSEKRSEELQKECNELVERIDNYKQQQQEQEDENKYLKQDNQNLLKERNQYEQQRNIVKSEINKINTKLKSLHRDKNDQFKEKKQLENELLKCKRDQEIDRNNLRQIDKEIMDTKKQAVVDSKGIRKLGMKKANLKEQLLKIEEQSKYNGIKIVRKDNEIEQKEKEIRERRIQAENINKKIIQLEKEKEKYGINAAQANAKYAQSLEEIKLKDNLISEFQKKNLEMEQRLRQQQTLYEAVRSDRNLYSKSLIETQDEITEIKRRYKIVNHQISQLKEEIDAKDAVLTKEKFEFKQFEKNIEEFSKKIEDQKKKLQSRREEIKNSMNEMGKLQFIINQNEAARKKLKEEYELVVSERDILGTQLIRRNDELALLYEKLKIQQSTLAKGEAEYRERILDLNLLDIKMKDLERAIGIYKKQADTIADLKEAVLELEKNLIDEKLKVKALSEELEDPLNVQRFRKLKGADPDSYEMIKKIEALQRRLITKTEEAVEQDVIIQQKEKNIQELREIMKRQPQIEEAKELSRLKESIRQKTKSMKASAAELNMFHAQINEYKYDIENLTDETQEIKRKYHEQKRREELEEEYRNREQAGFDMQ